MFPKGSLYVDHVKVVTLPETGQVWQSVYGDFVTVIRLPLIKGECFRIQVVFTYNNRLSRGDFVTDVKHFTYTHSFYAHNKYHAMWKRFKGLFV